MCLQSLNILTDVVYSQSSGPCLFQSCLQLLLCINLPVLSGLSGLCFWVLPGFQPLLLIVCVKISNSPFIKKKNMNPKRVCKPDLLLTKPGFVVGSLIHVGTFWFWGFGTHIDLSLKFFLCVCVFRFDLFQCIWSYASNVC